MFLLDENGLDISFKNPVRSMSELEGFIGIKTFDGIY
jgi:hypothetical protein